MVLILYILGVLLLAFALQLLLMRASRRGFRLVRWLELPAAAGFLVAAWQAHHTPTMFGLSDLVVVFDVILAVCILLGWGIAWGVGAVLEEGKGGLL